jgi:hypothetical protein
MHPAASSPVLGHQAAVPSPQLFRKQLKYGGWGNRTRALFAVSSTGFTVYSVFALSWALNL